MTISISIQSIYLKVSPLSPITPITLLLAACLITMVLKLGDCSNDDLILGCGPALDADDEADDEECTGDIADAIGLVIMRRAFC